MICTKKISSIFFGVLFAFTSCSQEKPVKWNFFAKKVTDKKYGLHLIAAIEPGWHFYSSNQPKTAIGLPTTINLTANPLLTYPGKPREKGKPQKVKNAGLGTEEYRYSGVVDFVRIVNVKANSKTKISGTVEFMACTDERCLPSETIAFKYSRNKLYGLSNSNKPSPTKSYLSHLILVQIACSCESFIKYKHPLKVGSFNKG